MWGPVFNALFLHCGSIFLEKVVLLFGFFCKFFSGEFLFESMKWTYEIGEKHKEFFQNKIYEESFVIILNYSSNYFRYFEAFFSWPVLLFSTCDYLPSETFCGMCQISGLFESSDTEIISIPKKITVVVCPLWVYQFFWRRFNFRWVHHQKKNNYLPKRIRTCFNDYWNAKTWI